jgi:hypothetical protein
MSALGPVEGQERMIRFPVGEQKPVVFCDKRAIVCGGRDDKLAWSPYAKYVNMWRRSASSESAMVSIDTRKLRVLG